MSSKGEFKFDDSDSDEDIFDLLKTKDSKGKSKAQPKSSKVARKSSAVMFTRYDSFLSFYNHRFVQ